MKDVVKIIFWVLVVIALVAMIPYIFMVSWNYIMPVIWKGAPHLGWLQSLALMVVGNALTGGSKHSFSKSK